MKEIKTILFKVIQVDEFDKTVNAALAEGWTLVKRGVLDEYDRAVCVTHRLLYAELEREIVYAPHDCQTCAHVDCFASRYPCCVCANADKWGPKP